MTITPDTTDTWNATLTSIVQFGMITIGAIDETETPTNDQMNSAIFSINAMLKEWEKMSIKVWTEQEGILFLQPSQSRYLIGPGTTDHACDAYNWNLGTLNTSYTAGTTVISVASGVAGFSNARGIHNGDTIGVVLDSGTIFWTTVNGAPSGLNVTLAGALPSSASSGNYIMDYPAGTDIDRPLDIPNARYLQYNGPTLTPMGNMSRQEYMDLPNPQNTGAPTRWFYNPRLNQGEMFIWLPVLNGGVYGVRFTWYRQIFDWLIATDNADFPQEWINAIKWNFAREEMVGYHLPPERVQEINIMALEKREMASGFSRETQPIRFIMDWDGRG